MVSLLGAMTGDRVTGVREGDSGRQSARLNRMWEVPRTVAVPRGVCDREQCEWNGISCMPEEAVWKSLSCYGDTISPDGRLTETWILSKS